MTPKTELKIEQHVSSYCWDNLPGDETWSNNFYNCALGGYEIAQKEIKQQILDLKNKYKSHLQEETNCKMGKNINFVRETELKAKISTLIELEKKLKL